MSIFSDIVKYLPILSKANWYYLGIARYTSQLQNIVRWCKLQIQYFISLYILGCPEILVDIFRRGSSSITRMCVYLSCSQKSLKILGCWYLLIFLEMAKYFEMLSKFITIERILLNIHQYWAMLYDIWCS